MARNNELFNLQTWFAAILVVVFSGCRSSREQKPGRSAEAERLFTATPLTDDGLFTKGVEGPACDREGNIYAVNFAREQTIGRVTPEGKAALFVTLPGKST